MKFCLNFKIKNSIAIILLSFLFSLPSSFAVEIPKSLLSDTRIRTISYNSDNVVSLTGNQLIQTAIEFGEDETILGVESGDSDSWTVKVNEHKPNILFIKPDMDNSNSSLTVMTDQHVYEFNLKTDSNLAANDITYVLRFTYPEKIQQQLQAALNAKKTLHDSVVNQTPIDPLSLNWNYDFSKRCSLENVPIKAFDDGKFTYFQFPPQTETPAIFIVDSEGHESLANFKTEGSYVVIERLARQFTFRNGNIVSCIFNEGYPA